MKDPGANGHGCDRNQAYGSGLLTPWTHQWNQRDTSAAGNSGCGSNTTGSFGLTETSSVIGGTGEFANASGSITFTVTGTTLAAPGSPPGTLGLFSGFQDTFTGSVTF
jgi:hypothetical protein